MSDAFFDGLSWLPATTGSGVVGPVAEAWATDNQARFSLEPFDDTTNLAVPHLSLHSHPSRPPRVGYFPVSTSTTAPPAVVSLGTLSWPRGGRRYFSFKVASDFFTFGLENESVDINGSGTFCVGFLTSTGPGAALVGFERNSLGQVRLVRYLADSLTHQASSTTPWLTLPEGVWREGELNCITLEAAGDTAWLWVNGQDTGLRCSGNVSNGTRVGIASRRRGAGGLTSENASIGEILLSDFNPGVYSIINAVPGTEATGNDFTPSEGADGFSMLADEVPDGDATYVSATDSGAKAVYGLTRLNGDPLNIDSRQEVRSVRIRLAARSELDARPLQILASDGSSDAAIGEATFGAGDYQRVEYEATQSPFSGLAWTPAEVNSLLVGFEITEGSD